MVKDYSYLVGNQFAKGQPPNKTAFKKGNIPPFKGIKGIHLSPKTEFRKGRLSENKLPLYSITKREGKGNSNVRQFIKIGEPNVWQLYAQYLWERRFGKLLKGDVTHHLNGNKLDDRDENIIALSRRDHPFFHNRRWGLREMTQKQIDFYEQRYLERAACRTGSPA